MEFSNSPATRSPEITVTTDEDGNEIAQVLCTSSDHPVVLELAVLRRLQKQGWTDRWACASDGHGNRYVVTYCRDIEGRTSVTTVARLVVGAEKGQRVRYRDGNRLNLRRENLYVEKGPARMAAHARPPRVGVLPVSMQATA
ncbi:hypothetical protein [Oleiagrimonas sp. C23AA]|uniref:hypothetical protein n=1 Tax=Oleiagrimonas sp. C23AA TaxID=2719047 RepID=UPI0014234163|nr:hypothetical protein [Oleiagrimonas sp. C23AA]NII11548.1 hypothetical protein [Oleiagrimonas sp. C23AA]